MTSRVKEIKIVRGLPQKVETEVNQMLSDGWQPQREMFTMPVDDTTILVQPMVKERYTRRHND